MIPAHVAAVRNIRVVTANDSASARPSAEGRNRSPLFGYYELSIRYHEEKTSIAALFSIFDSWLETHSWNVITCTVAARGTNGLR